MHVLVVDDDAGVRGLLKTALDQWDVHDVPDGNAALEYLASHTVDAVVLDVMMPGMDGFEVLTRIRRMPGREQLPVVMLTAKVSETDHVRGFKGGADGYVTKPFDVDELGETVRRVASMDPSARAELRREQLEKAELLRQIEKRFAAF